MFSNCQVIHGLFYTSAKIYEVGLTSHERKNRRYGFIHDCKVLRNVLCVDSE